MGALPVCHREHRGTEMRLSIKSTRNTKKGGVFFGQDYRMMEKCVNGKRAAR
jgi:hypothetical protein